MMSSYTHVSYAPSSLSIFILLIDKLDKQLNCRCHSHHIESKIADRISLLRFLSRSATEQNDKIMLNIYKSIARTILTYGYPVPLTAKVKI
jgi:hypothetical protein